MSEEKSEAPLGVRFRISAFRDLELIFPNIDDNLNEGENVHQGLGIKLAGAHRVDPSKSLILITATVEYIKNYQSDESKTLLSYTLEASFEVENFDEVISEDDDGDFTIPEPLLELLVSVTISTLRGVLISKTANSPLRGIHIPVITNLKELIQSW